LIFDAQFVAADAQEVTVVFQNRWDMSFETIQYERRISGSWQLARKIEGAPQFGHDGLQVAVKQGLNQPPVLVAQKQQKCRAIWDPNPQLKKLDLAEASVYTWKDTEGREWRGGLFKPVDYKAGQRYPLVIQTHGFTASEFRPSGFYPTAFAARELASVGIVVLQVQDLGCITSTIHEGPCAIAGYESAANQLVSEGLVDPSKIGIIGFSRTCFYVMETLTQSSVRVAAASITDGVMVSYFEYIFFEHLRRGFDSMIGAPPFGEGLQQWFKRSPSFNLHKVNAPLLVNAVGPISMLYMAGPYAGLRSLQKPVDLIMLNTDEHILSNPAERLASQGGSVDWFRFWLQGYEDPDPTKAEQFKRWRELRKLHEENDKKSAQACPTPESMALRLAENWNCDDQNFKEQL
jgi:hypothetical protein